MLLSHAATPVASRRRTHMITTRIATAAAILTFGLAGLGGTVVAIAAPAHADTATITHVDGTPMTGTAGPAVEDAGSIPDELRGRDPRPQRRRRPRPRQRRHPAPRPVPPQPRPAQRPRGPGPQGQQRTTQQPLNPGVRSSPRRRAQYQGLPPAPCSPAYRFAKQGSWLSLIPWLPWWPCGIDMFRVE